VARFWFLLAEKVVDKTFEHINPPGTKLCVNL
jgi:hypothetical protein